MVGKKRDTDDPTPSGLSPRALRERIIELGEKLDADGLSDADGEAVFEELARLQAEYEALTGQSIDSTGEESHPEGASHTFELSDREVAAEAGVPVSGLTKDEAAAVAERIRSHQARAAEIEREHVEKEFIDGVLGVDTGELDPSELERLVGANKKAFDREIVRAHDRLDPDVPGLAELRDADVEIVIPEGLEDKVAPLDGARAAGPAEDAGPNPFDGGPGFGDSGDDADAAKGAPAPAALGGGPPTGTSGLPGGRVPSAPPTTVTDPVDDGTSGSADGSPSADPGFDPNPAGDDGTFGAADGSPSADPGFDPNPAGDDGTETGPEPGSPTATDAPKPEPASGGHSNDGDGPKGLDFNVEHILAREAADSRDDGFAPSEAEKHLDSLRGEEEGGEDDDASTEELVDDVLGLTPDEDEGKSADQLADEALGLTGDDSSDAGAAEDGSEEGSDEEAAGDEASDTSEDDTGGGEGEASVSTSVDPLAGGFVSRAAAERATAGIGAPKNSAQPEPIDPSPIGEHVEQGAFIEGTLVTSDDLAQPVPGEPRFDEDVPLVPGVTPASSTGIGGIGAIDPGPDHVGIQTAGPVQEVPDVASFGAGEQAEASTTADTGTTSFEPAQPGIGLTATPVGDPTDAPADDDFGLVELGTSLTHSSFDEDSLAGIDSDPASHLKGLLDSRLGRGLDDPLGSDFDSDLDDFEF